MGLHTRVHFYSTPVIHKPFMKNAIGLERAGLQSMDPSIGSGYMQYIVPLAVSEVDVCPVAIKRGSCANINKSEHIYFIFAFYNEVLRSK